MLSLLAGLLAPPTQSLTTLHPTPSTISFIVSTRPAPTSLALKMRFAAALVLRVLLGLAALGVVGLKWRLSSGEAGIWEWAMQIRGMEGVLSALGRCGWIWIGSGAVVVLGAVVRRGYTEESLTVLRGLGIQTSSSAPTYLQAPCRRFLPTTDIQDIIIHEAFRGFEVRFYLAVVVKGEEDVVVVFPKLLPRRAMLEEVWRGARKCLWEGGREKS